MHLERDKVLETCNNSASRPPNQAQYFPRVIVNLRFVGVHPVIKEEERDRGSSAPTLIPPAHGDLTVQQLSRIWQGHLRTELLCNIVSETESHPLVVWRDK